MTTQETVNRLRAELLAAERLLAAEQKEKAMHVQPIYRFTLSLVTPMRGAKIYDTSCVLYTLTGEVINKEEMRYVGKTPFEGGMNYLFNTLSGKFVMAVGGGAVYTSDPWCLAALSSFILQNPNGGDVTSIVNHYRGED